MMNKTIVTALLWIFCSQLSAQVGTKFEQASWQHVIAKAKEANKFIFVDCYTTWCKPCKEMSLRTFPTSLVGDFMNLNFINVKVQMDSSAHDNEYVKLWYRDARELKDKYRVNVFPCFLLFAPDGQILHKYMGAIIDSIAFVAKLKEILNPDKQYYTLQRLYNKGKDVSLIPNLVNSAREANEPADAICNDFIGSLKNPYLKSNLEIIRQITKKSGDKGYKMFLRNSKRVNDSLGKDAAEIHIMWVLWNEEIAPIFKIGIDSINWSKIEAKVKDKSNTALSKELVAKAKFNYYGSKKVWGEYEKSLFFYLSNFGHAIQPYQLNNLLWYIFLHTADTKMLEAFLPWAKKSIEYDSNFAAGIDTYANFLYKLGRTEEAISWEKKAYDIACKEKNMREQKTLSETINKMQKGIKTWD